MRIANKLRRAAEQSVSLTRWRATRNPFHHALGRAAGKLEPREERRYQFSALLLLSLFLFCCSLLLCEERMRRFIIRSCFSCVLYIY